MKSGVIKNKTIPAKIAKVTVETVVIAYNALLSAKMHKMEYNDLKSAIKAMRVLKPVAEKYSETIKLCEEKMRDTEAEKANESMRERFDELTPQEQYKLNKVSQKYNEELIKMRREELDKIAELPAYDRINEAAFGKLIENNPDFTGVQIVALQDVLCK